MTNRLKLITTLISLFTMALSFVQLSKTFRRVGVDKGSRFSKSMAAFHSNHQGEGRKWSPKKGRNTDGDFQSINLGTREEMQNAEMEERVRESEHWVSASLTDEEAASFNRGLGIEKLVKAAKSPQSSKKDKFPMRKKLMVDSVREAAMEEADAECEPNIKGFLELNPYICSGCGVSFQSKSEGEPGYLQKEKLQENLQLAKLIRERQEAVKLLEMAGIDIGHPRAMELLRQANVSEEIIVGIQELSNQFKPRQKPQDDEPIKTISEETKVFNPRDEEFLDNLINSSHNKPQKLNTTKNSICVCQRCYRLQQYGQVDNNLRPGWSNNELLTPARFESLVSSIRSTRAVVLCIVDIFDLKGSLLPNLKQIAGPNPIVIAANKVDLLPSDVPEARLINWIHAEVKDVCQLSSPKEVEAENTELMREHRRAIWQERERRQVEQEEATLSGGKNIKNKGHYIPAVKVKSEDEGVLRRSNVHLISCQSGLGIPKLIDSVVRLAKQFDDKVYVMGAANVGKSSFINRLLENSSSGKNKKAMGHLSSQRKKGEAPRATVSSLPGTTLNFLKIALPNGVTLIDTPGLLATDQLTARLTTEELKKVIPTKPINAITLRVEEGKCVLIGGLAKIELLEGRPFQFSFFVSNDIVLHPTHTSRADDYTQKHIGTLLTPPFEIERIAELGPYESHDFTVTGEGWKESFVDVVIAGLGWVSITGAGECKIRVTVPKNTGVGLRLPLLPFEMRSSTATFTGGRLFKKSRKPTTSGAKSYGWRA